MKHTPLILLSAFLLFTADNIKAQDSYNVLFLGNSYTGTNDLPQIVHDLALSVGDTMVFDRYSPGGYHLSQHSADTVSQNKIMNGDWDYVVMQGQSRESITFPSTFHSGGTGLNAHVVQHKPCAVSMLYMTWGRENGDAANCAAYPVMCTYQGMDTTIRDKYIDLAEEINAEISPVSVVWNHIRQEHPSIDLYQADGSHPSVAGSYAAACCFYTALFKKDPLLLSYDHSLSAADAIAIRNVVKAQVFDQLAMWDHKEAPLSDFVLSVGPGMNEMTFSSVNYGTAETIFWDFGDGNTSDLSSVTHSYVSDGTYTVTLTTTNCDLQGLHSSTSDTTIQFCSHTPTISTIDPWLCTYDTLWTEVADSYQWYSSNMALPETDRFLANYGQYGGNIRVASTVGACTEMSALFSGVPAWSNYYFDAAFGGDPCIGDTALFIVLHTSGSLSGAETILWFRNDTLMPIATSEDTLLITTPGTYLCKLVDPNNTICPYDTVLSAEVMFDCDIVGIEDPARPSVGRVFPNPASETITVQLGTEVQQEQLRIYSALGRLMKVLDASGTTQVSIADLPSGLYFIRIGGSEQALRFVRQ